MCKSNQKLIDGFTKRYYIDKLMYFETFQYINVAIKREKNMRNWKRQWKINLIIEVVLNITKSRTPLLSLS